MHDALAYFLLWVAAVAGGVLLWLALLAGGGGLLWMLHRLVAGPGDHPPRGFDE
jgi:hypothetical protein